ncbi:hypothetical protein F0562_029255 [Nyssa sinensis]|uniref:Exonuclease domain-containing protein n=1 Tax=Nyssa sinensis TaxID=561372 RepID=A0A5J5B4M7_9ASTE|nr:hypothetical protein F0562_029255 [Nyssa sinensis]
MRTVAMCFSVLQVPRCRIHTLASSWWESFHSLSRTSGNSSNFKLLGSNNYGLEGGHSRRWTRRPISTKTEGRNKNTLSSKTSSITHDMLDGKISANTKLSINKSEISEFQRIQYCDIQQKIAENKDLASLLTLITFDMETTGLSRENERIIEIAMQDLLGGENSTFQTLVNPERYVPNPHVHGISTHMVNRPDVPRMKDLIPILLQYVRSRQKPGGNVVLIAHNARCFDVPFLIKEFSRCSVEVPPDWLFVDTLPLARELMKLGGSKLSSKTSLQALREYYGIPLVGSAHRAMSDVYSLSLILQRMTFDLKLPVSSLVERSFTASDLIKLKKKKNSG